MTQFNGKWIYTLDTSGDLELLTVTSLPKVWTNPVTGTQYGDLHQLPISFLNGFGWYQVIETAPVKNQYQKYNYVSRNFDNEEFTDTYEVVWRNIEVIRERKLGEVDNEKDAHIENKLDNRSIDANLYILFKIQAQIISAFADANPITSINNNNFLQNILTKVNLLNIEVDVFLARMDQIETEQDILTLTLI